MEHGDQQTKERRIKYAKSTLDSIKFWIEQAEFYIDREDHRVLAENAINSIGYNFSYLKTLAKKIFE